MSSTAGQELADHRRQDRPLGLALFPIELAYSGLSFQLGAAGGPAITTISMPPIMPKSLGVKLDEM